MKALVYTGERRLEMRELPDPVPGPGEALIRVDASGICGSDIHAWLGHDERRPAPLILGHEVAGTVMSGAMQGQRVTVNPLATCGNCPACLAGRDNLCPERQIISMPPREGGFAEFITSPERNLVTIPDSLPASIACMAEPLACGWHGIRLASRALEGAAERALILGGGAIGFGAALAARAFGTRDITIVEPNPTRRSRLSTLDNFRITESAPAGLNPDLVVDAAGFAATRLIASDLVRPGGVIVHIGLGEAMAGLNIRRMTLQEISFIGTYTYTSRDFTDCAKAISEGSLGPCNWAETRALHEGAAAFSDIISGRIAAPKLVLLP
ncbi:zinc-dependent alcohol dehydrogenase [Pseudogemmobacter faecipullorum]|uniref:Alcohol dehydrogenase catalytic domain-containing protein n=1 Tax=Pseudogemmobacter faecipullorum TaxID=2755041 RepID=A0ABS8CM01_9RHOB|nr:alcohol dehydrogenase catalytic domain-containing protein [Pseudogemmobacter faecipullorum]MCB5410417.1 alcohol dehydrogenase catalytic domain-containing protein [Pseudogemmobacter faecipullorum]